MTSLTTPSSTIDYNKRIIELNDPNAFPAKGLPMSLDMDPVEFPELESNTNVSSPIEDDDEDDDHIVTPSASPTHMQNNQPGPHRRPNVVDTDSESHDNNYAQHALRTCQKCRKRFSDDHFKRKNSSQCIDCAPTKRSRPSASKVKHVQEPAAKAPKTSHLGRQTTVEPIQVQASTIEESMTPEIKKILLSAHESMRHYMFMTATELTTKRIEEYKRTALIETLTEIVSYGK